MTRNQREALQVWLDAVAHNVDPLNVRMMRDAAKKFADLLREDTDRAKRDRETVSEVQL